METSTRAILMAGAAVSAALATRSVLHALVVMASCGLACAALESIGAARRANQVERAWSLRRRRFDLSPSGGFLPEVEPSSVKLPREFAPWEALASQLPRLNRSGELRAAVEALPLLRAEGLLLVTPYEARSACVRRAYVALGLAVHSYAYGHKADWSALPPDKSAETREPCSSTSEEDDAADAAPRQLPPQLAVPWLWLCAQLDLPTGAITAAGTDLWNWRRVPAGRFELVFSMTGTATESAFHELATRTHVRMGTLLPELLAAPEAVSAGDDRAVLELLRGCEAALRDTRRIFDEVWQTVDAAVFYEVYRPLLSGSWDAPLSMVTADGTSTPARSKGPSAGQSTVFLLLDLALGIRNAALDGPDDSPHSSFQVEMLAYMPAPHRVCARVFADALADVGSLAEYVAVRQKKKTGPRSYLMGRRLRRALDDALESYAQFRKFHLVVATRYLKRTTTGTGGSDFPAMLRDGIERTLATQHDGLDQHPNQRKTD